MYVYSEILSSEVVSVSVPFPLDVFNFIIICDEACSGSGYLPVFFPPTLPGNNVYKLCKLYNKNLTRGI